MFFILSRIFACIASPLFYILIVLSIGYFTKKHTIKKAFFFISIIIFLLFSNRYIYNASLKAYTCEYISSFDSLKNYKYAILPGGFTDYDHIRQRVEYGFAIDRMIDAVELYKKGKVKKLIFTGDGASTITGNKEKFIQHLNEVWNIPSKDILIEPDARNTFENIKFSLKMVPDINDDNTIVINSALYMRRTIQCCSQLDFYPSFYATDIKISTPLSWIYFIPDFHVIDDWMRLIHEWIGCIAYNFIE